jgi:hypothetical protein
MAFSPCQLLVALPHGHGPWAFAIHLFFLGWTLRFLWLAITRQIRPAVTGLSPASDARRAFIVRPDQVPGY